MEGARGSFSTLPLIDAAPRPLLPLLCLALVPCRSLSASLHNLQGALPEAGRRER